MRREYAKFSGWASLILAVVTGVTYAVRNTADWGLWLPLGLCVATAAFWLVEFRAEAAEVVRSRRARQGGQSVVYTLAVLAIVVLAQALVINNDHSFDLTKNKDFTLADETIKTVRALDQKVQFFAFYGPDNRGPLEDLLKQVKAVNPSKVDYEFVDPNRKPLMAEEYGVHALGTTVLSVGDKKETLTGTHEEDLLNALLKVSNGVTKQVYVLSGHQEHSLDNAQPDGLSTLKKGLESSSFGVQTLNLGTVAKGEVPDDAAAVLVDGPHTDLQAPELDSLTRYLGRGGRVLVFLDVRTALPGLKDWLAKAGVAADDDIVIDNNPFNQIMGNSPLAPIVQTFDPSHPATKDLAEQKGQGIFVMTRTVSLGKLPDGGSGTVLVKSLPTAFGWTGSGNRAPAQPSGRDKRGPLDLMVSVEDPLKAFGGDASDPDKKARLVVVGTSQISTNQYVSIFNNQDLIVNSLRWLADEEKRISLAPKPKESEPLLLDLGRQQMIIWSQILLALGALAAGLAVAVSRRRQA